MFTQVKKNHFQKALYTPPKRNIKRYCNVQSNVQLFQTANKITDVRYVDIEDALNSSHNMYRKDKIDYFSTLGLNYEKIEQYYTYVLSLEKQFNPPKSDIEIIIDNIYKMISHVFSK